MDLTEIPVEKPVFLLGTQGGGLTLISRVLRRHPSAISVTGDSSYWVGSDEMQNVLSDVLPDTLRLQGHSVLERRGLQDSWLYATDELLPHFRHTAADANEETSKVLLERLRELLLLYGGTEPGYRFVDKSQSYTLKVSFLSKLLEGHEPKFLLVTRNPYAVCHRAVERVLTNIGLPLARRRRLAAEHWCNSMRCALVDAEGMDGFGTIRFEDFLIRPKETLSRIDEVVDMGLDADLLPSADDRLPLGKADQGEKWYPLRPKVNRKYLEDLPTQVVEAVDDRCADLVERFGYGLKDP